MSPPKMDQKGARPTYELLGTERRVRLLCAGQPLPDVARGLGEHRHGDPPAPDLLPWHHGLTWHPVAGPQHDITGPQIWPEGLIMHHSLYNGITGPVWSCPGAGPAGPAPWWSLCEAPSLFTCSLSSSRHHPITWRFPRTPVTPSCSTLLPVHLTHPCSRVTKSRISQQFCIH